MLAKRHCTGAFWIGVWIGVSKGLKTHLSCETSSTISSSERRPPTKTLLSMSVRSVLLSLVTVFEEFARIWEFSVVQRKSNVRNSPSKQENSLQHLRYRQCLSQDLAVDHSGSMFIRSQTFLSLRAHCTIVLSQCSLRRYLHVGTRYDRNIVDLLSLAQITPGRSTRTANFRITDSKSTQELTPTPDTLLGATLESLP